MANDLYNIALELDALAAKLTDDKLAETTAGVVAAIVEGSVQPSRIERRRSLEVARLGVQRAAAQLEKLEAGRGLPLDVKMRTQTLLQRLSEGLSELTPVPLPGMEGYDRTGT